MDIGSFKIPLYTMNFKEFLKRYNETTKIIIKTYLIVGIQLRMF